MNLLLGASRDFSKPPRWRRTTFYFHRSPNNVRIYFSFFLNKIPQSNIRSFHSVTVRNLISNIQYYYGFSFCFHYVRFTRFGLFKIFQYSLFSTKTNSLLITTITKKNRSEIEKQFQ